MRKLMVMVHILFYF